MNVAGRRIIVTGASSGIGWELAKQLAEAGARVVAAARSAAHLRDLQTQVRNAGHTLEIVPTDVAQPADRRRLIEQSVALLGGIDTLINNAGLGASGYFDEADPARLRTIFEVNFFGATELTRLAIPHLAAGRAPMLVNVSSVIGRRAVPGHAEYCASKFAVCGWSEAIRAEFVRQGIHVLLVCPGLIETPFKENQLERKLSFAWQERKAMTARVCAAQIIRAMRDGKNECVITWDGRLLVRLNRWFPRLVDWYLARMIRKTPTA